MNKLISVIVPVYNNEKFLHRCIQSLVEQEYANIEILLIDDGSSDASPQICDEWAKKDKRINVIHKVNGGVSSARNLGLKECSGKYVCFVDSDDFIDKYFISKMFSKLGDKDLVFCKMNIYNNDTKQITKLNENQLDKLIADKSVKNFYIGRPKLHGSVCRCIFKKDFIFTREKVFNEGIKYCEDLLVMTELILRKPKIDFVNEHLYFYCENMNSVTRDIKIGYSDKFLLGIEKCAEILRCYGYNDCANQVEFEAYIIACKECCYNKNVNIKEKKEFIYRNRDHYRQYIKNSFCIKEKIKAFLSWHKCFRILKVLYK